MDARSKVVLALAALLGAVALVLGGAWIAGRRSDGDGALAAPESTSAARASAPAQLAEPAPARAIQAEHSADTRVAALAPPAPRAPAAPAAPWMAGVIACRVVDAHGHAIAGASIEAGRELLEGAIEHRATTDERGRFELTDLRPGRWHVTVAARGFHAAEVIAQLLPETPELRGDIALELECVLAVSVRTGSGGPWPEEDGALLDRLRPALAGLCADPGGAFGIALDPVAQNVKSVGTTEAQWRIRHAEPGPVCLSVVAGVRVLASQPIGACQRSAEVRLDPDEVRAAFQGLTVRVVAAEDGAPIAGARVEARGELGEPRAALTDERGVATVDGLPPDVLVVRASAEGWCPGRASASWPAHGRLGLAPVEIQLRRATPIEGLARWDDGRPASEVWIWPTRDDGQFYSRAADARAVPTVRGAFRIADLAPGRWTVSLDPERVADGSSAVLDTRRGPARGIVLSGARAKPVEEP